MFLFGVEGGIEWAGKWVCRGREANESIVPDYYGEKITSVQGYRNWLKDQRAFNKKRTSVV
jgi:hypothetical protein